VPRRRNRRQGTRALHSRRAGQPGAARRRRGRPPARAARGAAAVHRDGRTNPSGAGGEGAGPVTCTVCGHENRATARFCEECAAPLTRVCANCQAELRPQAKFCDTCGQAVAVAPARAATVAPASYTPRHLAEKILTSRSALAGERKTITALFADIKGSMELMEDLDPEEARAIIDPALKLMMEAVRRYDGYIVQSTGDGIFALFGAPLAHEDHPQRGLYAALRLQEVT